jgi:hypothetical protein
MAASSKNTRQWDCGDGTSFLATASGKPQWDRMMIGLYSEDRSQYNGMPYRTHCWSSQNNIVIASAEQQAVRTTRCTDAHPNPAWDRDLGTSQIRQLNRDIRQLASSAGLDLSKEQGFHKYSPDVPSGVVASVLSKYPAMSPDDARYHINKAISVYAGEIRRRRKSDCGA